MGYVYGWQANEDHIATTDRHRPPHDHSRGVKISITIVCAAEPNRQPRTGGGGDRDTIRNSPHPKTPSQFPGSGTGRGGGGVMSACGYGPERTTHERTNAWERACGGGGGTGRDKTRYAWYVRSYLS